MRHPHSLAALVAGRIKHKPVRNVLPVKGVSFAGTAGKSNFIDLLIRQKGNKFQQLFVCSLFAAVPFVQKYRTAVIGMVRILQSPDNRAVTGNNSHRCRLVVETNALVAANLLKHLVQNPGFAIRIPGSRLNVVPVNSDYLFAVANLFKKYRRPQNRLQNPQALRRQALFGINVSL